MATYSLRFAKCLTQTNISILFTILYKLSFNFEAKATNQQTTLHLLCNLAIFQQCFCTNFLLEFLAVGPEIRMNKRDKNNLLVIKCKCGAELLLVPDLKSMSEAIENHVAEHVAKKERTTAKGADQIRDHLIGQVFEKASKQ